LVDEDRSSQKYLRYCEAKTLASWDLKKRANYMSRLEKRTGSEERVKALKHWFKLKGVFI